MRDTSLGLIFLSLGLVLFAAEKVAGTQSVERQLIVSVVDSNGTPIADLDASDFVVREDGARREILDVQPDTERKQIALLVDTSQAAAPAVGDFKRAAKTFIETMGEGNEVSIISFGGTPRILTEATGDQLVLSDGVDKIFSYSDTASYLLDAVTETVQGFERRSTPRPVIVIMTTLGLDHSSEDDRGALAHLKNVGVTTHSLVLTRSTNSRSGFGGRNSPGSVLGNTFIRDPFPTHNEQRNKFLDQASHETGGHRRDLQTFSSVERAMNELVSQLENQYMLVYSRPSMLIPPEEFDVTVNREGVNVRATAVLKFER
tara:strand:+ start:3001 stop:3951 length:951 start_codon:yes stop_codon:yes gene_type:complete